MAGDNAAMGPTKGDTARLFQRYSWKDMLNIWALRHNHIFNISPDITNRTFLSREGLGFHIDIKNHIL